MRFMNRVSRVFLVCALFLTCLAGVSAQTVSPAPEQSPSAAPAAQSEARARILDEWGLKEDPGLDPDPTKVFTRFGTPYHIHKYDIEKARSVFDQPEGWVRPFGWVNIPRQIYRRDEKFVWVWAPVPSETPVVNLSPLAKATLTLNPEQIKHLARLTKDFEESPFRTTDETVKFTESSAGLPADGSWRNSLDVADMNGDGHLDIIAPPQRTVDPNPSIFLGDGKGGWKRWDEARFSLGLNYGSVAAADFNRDGHMDLVFGVHLCCVVPFLGDGKGNFTDSREGVDDYFPSRRVRVRDFNKDGYPDIIANTEGPSMLETDKRAPGKVRAYLNQKKGKSWKTVSVAGADRYVGGDWLTVGNFNDDKYLDVAASSIYYGGMDVFYLGKPDGTFEPFGREWMPIASHYTALASGKFTSKKREDVIVTFQRQWLASIDPNDFPPPDQQRVSGLDRVSWKDGTPKRYPIARWAGGGGVVGLGPGDFNRDGHLDLALIQIEPRRLVVLLGDGKGGFRKADLEGLQLQSNPIYDAKVADVNRDGWDDLLLMYEAEENAMTKNGSVRVYLNRAWMGSGPKTAQALSPK